jgi:predicted DCC family thiol-disulfide oxidoreductase YuxK
MARFVYDDDCGFCTWWAEFFAECTDVELVGFSELDEELRERLPDGYEDCAHLITDEGVYSCGEAIEQTFVRSDIAGPARPLLDLFRQSAVYENVREGSYRRVADQRALWGKVLSADTSGTDEG